VNGWSAAHAWAPLPALYVVLLALGGAAALRRWFDPLPGRVLLLFLLYVGLLLAPALAGDAVLLPVDVLRGHAPFRGLPPSHPPAVFLQRDLVHQIAPWELLVKRALGGGRWPLWNPYEGTGMPLMADPQAQPFQPLVLLAYPFSIWTAAAVTAALKVLSALAFTFLLCRRQGLGEAAAAVGATAFGLGGFVMLWLGWPIATCAALLPAVLYAIARCDDVGGRRDFLLLALASAALVLGGHPEALAYAAGFAGCFLLDRVLDRLLAHGRRLPGAAPSAAPGALPSAREEPSPASAGSTPDWTPGWAPGRTLLARSGLAAALGAALAAPVLLPTLAFLPTTQRAAAVEEALAPQPLADLWHELLRPRTLALWRWRALHRLVPIAAPDAFGDQHTAYWGENNYIQDAAEFVGTATLLLALAGLAAQVPRARRFRQERMAGLALLGGLALLAEPPGFDRLAMRLPLVGLTATHRHQRIQLVVTFCLCYLAACGLEHWRRGEVRRRTLALAGAAVLSLVAAGYLANSDPRGRGGAWDFRLPWLWWQAAALAAGAGALWWPLRRRRGRTAAAPPSWAPWAVTAVIAAELLGFYAGANPPNERRLAFPRPPAVRFLQAHLDGDRLIGAGRALPANFAAVYGLADASIDDPAIPARYARATRGLDRGVLEPRFGRFGHPFYDFLGVRYVVAPAGMALPFRLAFADAGTWIWERPEPLPRLFLPERAHIDRDGAWDAWLEANPDFGFRVLVEAGAAVHRRWRAARPDDSSLRLELLASARLRAAATLAEPRLLAASIYQDGGWRVLAGGDPLPPVLVNGAFAGAWLPPGRTTIDLLYRPQPLLWGCLLAALAAAAGAAWWGAPPRLVARARAPRPPG
jgi:hypothetical protein